LLVTVNNRLILEIEIVHDLSCHPINRWLWLCGCWCKVVGGGAATCGGGQ